MSYLHSLHRFSHLMKGFGHEHKANVTPLVQTVAVGVSAGEMSRRAVSTNGQTCNISILTRNHLIQREEVWGVGGFVTWLQ